MQSAKKTYKNTQNESANINNVTLHGVFMFVVVCDSVGILHTETMLSLAVSICPSIDKNKLTNYDQQCGIRK